MGILPIFLILLWFLHYFYLEPLVQWYGLLSKKNVEIQQFIECRLLQNDYSQTKCIISSDKRKPHSKVSKIHILIPLSSKTIFWQGKKASAFFSFANAYFSTCMRQVGTLFQVHQVKRFVTFCECLLTSQKSNNHGQLLNKHLGLCS